MAAPALAPGCRVAALRREGLRQGQKEEKVVEGSKNQLGNLKQASSGDASFLQRPCNCSRVLEGSAEFKEELTLPNCPSTPSHPIHKWKGTPEQGFFEGEPTVRIPARRINQLTRKRSCRGFQSNSNKVQGDARSVDVSRNSFAVV